MRLPVASFAEAEELEDDSLSTPGQNAHTGLQLLVAPLERSVQRPQVLDGRRVQEVVLGQPCAERLEFICNTRRKKQKRIRRRGCVGIGSFGCNLLLRRSKLAQMFRRDVLPGRCGILLVYQIPVVEFNRGTMRDKFSQHLSQQLLWRRIHLLCNVGTDADSGLQCQSCSGLASRKIRETYFLWDE